MVDKATIKEDLSIVPPEGSKEIGRKVFELLDDVIQDKENLGLPSRWKEYYNLRRNKHWKTDTRKLSLVSVNLLGAHTQRAVNMLTDGNPTFNVAKIGGNVDIPDELYEDYLHVADFWWTDQEQQSVLQVSVGNGEMYGVTIEKVIFNPDLEFGLGEVETVIVDPLWFGIWPVTCKEVQKADAVLHYYPMSVREVKRKWPDKTDDIKADEEYLAELGDDRREVQGGRGSTAGQGWRSTIGGIVKSILSPAGQPKGSKDDRTVVVECWVKDYTMDKDETGQEIPKYPGFIRCIRACCGGEVVLDDRPNPSINPTLPLDQAMNTYLFDKFPFSKTQSVQDDVTGWGFADYEQLEGLQVEFDKTISQYNLWKDKAARLKLINPKNSGIPNEHFTNAPGIIRPRDEIVAQALRYMDPPPIPADLVNALTMYKEFFYLVSGAFEIEQAQSPGRSVIAYKAIAALLERATLMLKGKIRNYSMMIRERGRMYMSHVQNWYTEERWISWQEDGVDQSKAIVGTNLIIPAKLKIVSGSTMPVSQVQRREEAIDLFKANAIDQEELLKRLDWEDRRSVLKRMKEGPLGILIGELEQLGAPPGLLQLIQELISMDPKDFEKALKAGEIPPIQAVMTPPEEQAPPPPDPTVEADVQQKQAQAQKIMAEIELIKEQIVSERIKQYVQSSGVKLDAEKLKIERAKVINDMKKEMDMAEIGPEGGQGPFRDKSLKSDNKEAGE